MIKSIKVINHLGESIQMSLTKPQESGFIIRSITGLGPPKANVIFTELATMDGSIDNSARLETRNIVLSLWFLENPTIEATRLLSYKYFPIKRTITFEVETDSRVCTIEGRVESNEPDIFSKKEGCQVSIVCPDPYFYSKNSNQKVFYGTDPMFEFPFENPVDMFDLVMGDIVHHTQGSVIYEGDGETGIQIYIHATGAASGLQIYDLKKRQVMRIDDERLAALTGSGIIAGDEITIETSPGKKGVWLLRSGVTTNILNTLGRPIQWFSLEKGDNLFAYTTETGLENLQFRIDNKVLYEGV